MIISLTKIRAMALSPDFSSQLKRIGATCTASLHTGPLYYLPNFFFFKREREYKRINLKVCEQPGVLAHTLNPSTEEAEVDGSL